MTTISVEDAQQNVAALIRRVEAGEAFLIARGGEPLGRLEPIHRPVDSKPVQDGSKIRHFGTLAGKIRIPSDFNEIMRAEIEEMFSGEA